MFKVWRTTRNQPLTVIFFLCQSGILYSLLRYIWSHSSINKLYIKNFPPLVSVAILLLNKWYSPILYFCLYEFEVTTFFGQQKRSLKYAEHKILHSSSWPDTSSYQIMGLRACHINTTITEQVKKKNLLYFTNSYCGYRLLLKVLFVTICKKRQVSVRNMRNCILYARCSKCTEHIFLLHILVM